MKTVKPLRLSIMHRPYRWQEADALGVAVVALVSLDNQSKLLPDQEIWPLAADEAGGLLDLFVPKAYPEILVGGYAYPCHQPDPTACAVRLKIGPMDKSLLVFGDRYWLDGKPSAPQPFQAMPIDWQHAYGGPDFAANRVGIGAQDEIVNGIKVRRLPNIESPHERLSSPAQQARPAGLAAIALDHPDRLARMGRQYDRAWQEQAFPGFAKDMDWRFFNLASADQWGAEGATLAGGIPYEIWNMHPEQQVLRGQLPDWDAKCFYSRQQDGSALEETPMRLSTAWFFPHKLRAVLIWHGSIALQEDDAADIKHIMPALELPGQARGLPHYQQVLAQRIDPRHGALHVFRDADLLPEAVCAAWDIPDVAERPLVRRLQQGAERARARNRRELASQGLNADDYLPPAQAPEKMPALSELPEYMERVERERQESMQQALQVRDRHLADPELQAAARQAGVDLDSLGRVDQPGKPGHVSVDEMMGLLEQFGNTANSDGPAAPGPSLKTQMAPQVREAYARTAHLYEQAPRMAEHRQRRVLRRIEAARASGRSCAGMNLTGADLAGLDLRGVDLRGALLAGADLSHVMFDDCDLSGAVLAGATLAQTSLQRANLAKANLGQSRCNQACFAQADLTDAVLQQGVFLACDFSQATLLRTRLDEARIGNCVFRAASLRQWCALEATFEDVEFGQAQFQQCVFLQSRLCRVQFTGATLERTGFIKTDCDDGIDFSQASLDGCGFAGGSSLQGACFQNAIVKQSGFRGTCLRGADLRGAALHGCDFSECDFGQAQLSYATAPESLFVRADFTDASLAGTDFIEARLAKSHMLRTDLRGANLFRADVSMAYIDDTTRMDGAYTQGAQLWPARRARRAS